MQLASWLGRVWRKNWRCFPTFLKQLFYSNFRSQSTHVFFNLMSKICFIILSYNPVSEDHMWMYWVAGVESDYTHPFSHSFFLSPPLFLSFFLSQSFFISISLCVCTRCCYSLYLFWVLYLYSRFLMVSLSLYVFAFSYHSCAFYLSIWLQWIPTLYLLLCFLYLLISPFVFIVKHSVYTSLRILVNGCVCEKKRKSVTIKSNNGIVQLSWTKK